MRLRLSKPYGPVMPDMLTFDLRYAVSSPAPTRVRFEGRPSDAAIPLIVEALQAAGVNADFATGLALAPADALEESNDHPDSQFLLLQGDETLADLRSLIGPDDDSVWLRSMGWGGSDTPEFYFWLVNDLLPWGRAALELYGAVEVVRVIGRSIEAKKHRETIREAQTWLRWNNSEVQGNLLAAVRTYEYWAVDRAKKSFGLDDAGIGKLMAACGYEYEPDAELYIRSSLLNRLETPHEET